MSLGGVVSKETEKVVCPSCKGNGLQPHGNDNCWKCEGTGFIKVEVGP